MFSKQFIESVINYIIDWYPRVMTIKILAISENSFELGYKVENCLALGGDIKMNKYKYVYDQTKNIKTNKIIFLNKLLANIECIVHTSLLTDEYFKKILIEI